MGGVWWELALLAGLILINAFFTASEIALVSLRHSQLTRMRQRGGADALAARFGREPTRYLATIQIGITLAGFLASAVAATSLALPLVPLLRPLGWWAEPVAVGAVTVALSFVSLVLGELVPKRLAMQRPEPWARLAARPLAVMGWLTAPAVWLLSVTTELIVRLLGGAGRGREAPSKDEMRDVITQGARGATHRSILLGALDLAEERLRHVVVPRGEVTALPATLPAGDAVGRLVAATHSRAPVLGSSIDDIRGVVTLWDLIGRGGTVADHARSVLLLPESLPVLDALRRMQSEHQQLAVVVDEYGGTEGVITVEDLLEEVVGEIYDEFDREQLTVQRMGDGSLLASGATTIHDLSDLGVVLPEGAYTTVGGLALAKLGHIAAVGDAAYVAGWRIEVLAVRGASVKRLRLTPMSSQIPRSRSSSGPTLAT